MAKQFQSIFSNNKALAPVLNKAQELQRLQQIFSETVPYHMAQACRIVGLQFGTLNIAIANATVATRLRQMEAELVQQLQEKGCEVQHILFKVSPQLTPSVREVTPRKLSPNARQALQNLEQNLKDSPLKRALAKVTKA